MAESLEIARLRELIDKARRLTASDPDNVWCRQATILLNYAMTGNMNDEKTDWRSA